MMDFYGGKLKFVLMKIKRIKILTTVDQSIEVRIISFASSSKKTGTKIGKF
ncbi:MAG: hypothetical protein LBF33_02165 [Oscillospiraceae bacterium]|nr:hypothetical protein [Oscillospiraceae bacterium]